MAKVNVLLPVYNGAGCLDRALSALSAQTFADMKIVISDNASTDATPEIIARWQAKDSRIFSFRQKENIGAIANFQWALAQADAPFIMFACHDDIWSPNFVEELHRVLASSPEVDLAVPQMVLIRPNNSPDLRLFHEPVNTMQGVRRAFRCVLKVHSGWFYGLYRQEALAKTWQALQSFERAWGGDFIGLLPILLTGRAGGSNAAIYYKQETPLSAARYRPKTLTAQWAFYRHFLGTALRLLFAAPVPLWWRLVLLPSVVVYADRHGWRLRRLIVSALGLKKY